MNTDNQDAPDVLYLTRVISHDAFGVAVDFNRHGVDDVEYIRADIAIERELRLISALTTLRDMANHDHEDAIRMRGMARLFIDDYFKWKEKK